MFTRLIEKSGAAPGSLDLSESEDQIEEEGGWAYCEERPAPALHRDS